MTRAKDLLMVSLMALAARSAMATSVAEQLRQLAPDVGRAVRVDGFSLQAGMALVILDEGVLVPSTPVAGRPVELAFVGRGRVELEAPDPVEAGQLELFTGSSVLEEGFDRAVLVVTLDAAVDAVLRRPRALPDQRIDEAAALYKAWRVGTERALLDVDARVFADGAGDRLASGFFCAAIESERLGHFLVVVDPLADEQMTVGQFVRPELSRREQRRLRRTLEDEQRSGGLIGLDVADLGTWDTWVSASLTGIDGGATPGTRGAEPLHYDLDVSLGGADLALESTARLSLRVLVGDLRAVSLEMNADLEPRRVIDARGRELEWWRSRHELVVVLAEPAQAGERLGLAIEYGGRPLERASDGVLALRHPSGWYPHAGTIDRATYDLTVTWPGDLEVLAPGAAGDLVRTSDGRTRRRWRVEAPTPGTSFEIGRFQRISGRAGDVAIDVAVIRTGAPADTELAREIFGTVVDAVQYFERTFGPYPLDRLQVVSTPRGFSQGLLGLVTLSAGAVADWQEWGAVLGLEDQRTVIAHEVAHQWWGNLVGWRSYRDQWISEAMANYAALLWASARLHDSGDGPLLRGPTAGWQAELLRPLADGRPVESLGPLVVGARLDSSLSRDAYASIVYKKGALVLNMLAQLFGEDAFVAMLGDIVEAASGRVISTSDLLDALHRLGGIDLGCFGRQYIYGTGLPEIVYRYRFEELGRDRWAVVGEARQRAPTHTDLRVVESSFGVLDVRRREVPKLDAEGWRLVVPFQIGVVDRSSGNGGRSIVAGRVPVSGPTSPFRIEVERRPEVLWLDREAEVFGRFFAVDRWPRLAAYLGALELEAAGDPEGAGAELFNALAAPVAVVPTGWEASFAPVDVTAEGRRLDARIRLALARLHLDAGRLAEARTEVTLARDLVASRDRWLLAADLLAVESRLDLLSGDAKPALRRLQDAVLGRRGVETPETWTLLAVAAAAVGDTDVLNTAAERASKLGVDLGPLTRTIHDAPSPSRRNLTNSPG